MVLSTMAVIAIRMKRIDTTIHAVCDRSDIELWSTRPLSCSQGTTEVAVTVTVTDFASSMSTVSAQGTVSMEVTVTIIVFVSASESAGVHSIGVEEVASVIGKRKVIFHCCSK